MIYGSFLLFVTNLVGITLSAALTFIVLGFAPIKRAKKGIFFTSILMVIIAIPLYISFMNVVDRYDYFNKLNSFKSIALNGHDIELNIKKVQNNKNEILVNIDVISSQPLILDDYNIIKEKLQKEVDKKLVLEIVPVIIVK